MTYPYIFVNPYLIVLTIMVALMGFGIVIYIGLVVLYRNIKNRPKRVTHTYKLTPPGPPTVNPIGVSYSNTIKLKEPAITTMNIYLDEWDWQ